MRFLILLCLVISLFAEQPDQFKYEPGDMYTIPLQTGLFNFEWRHPCWLVSTNSFKKMLSATTIVTNYQIKEVADEKAVYALMYQTNMDRKYIFKLEKKTEDLMKDIRRLQRRIGLSAGAGATIMGLIFYGTYELASRQNN